MKIGDEIGRYLDQLRDIITANYEVGTQIECEIDTGSISSFEIARSEFMESREELVMFLENNERCQEMKDAKSNIKLYV